MPLFQRVLVPVDFSDCSREALTLALQFADAFQSKVRVLHIWQPPDFAGADLMVMAHSEGVSLGQYGKRKAAEAMAELLESCGATDNVESEIAIGDPRHSIIEFAKSSDADLIIMGTHGRTGRARLFAGSVAEAVVRCAHIPVLTVHEHR